MVAIVTSDEQQIAKRRLRHIAHIIGIAFAIFVYLAVFLITGDVDLVYALIAAAGLGLTVWLLALWYVENHLGSG